MKVSEREISFPLKTFEGAIIPKVLEMKWHGGVKWVTNIGLSID